MSIRSSGWDSIGAKEGKINFRRSNSLKSLKIMHQSRKGLRRLYKVITCPVAHWILIGISSWNELTKANNTNPPTWLFQDNVLEVKGEHDDEGAQPLLISSCLMASQEVGYPFVHHQGRIATKCGGFMICEESSRTAHGLLVTHTFSLPTIHERSSCYGPNPWQLPLPALVA